jgi:DNA-binding transcriptional ArsR family regulator
MDADAGIAAIASAIAEPARARMLCALLDGRARTATELSAVAEVAASTASAHLARLTEQRLVDCMPQGKHRYYQLAGADVARALEALLVVAGVPRPRFRPSTPPALRSARTCYDHMAGEVAVALLAQMKRQRWLTAHAGEYRLSAQGEVALADWGVDVDATRRLRRKFACDCLDWSERRPHLGGALGAALLGAALRRKWLQQDLDGRGLQVTAKGRREWLVPQGIGEQPLN